MSNGGTVVTATANLAQHWQAHIQRDQQTGGMLAWRTPDILPLNAWIERLWHSSLLAGGAAGQRDLLSAAQFRQITDYLLNNVLPASLPGSRRNAGRMVIQAWQLCRGWQVSVEDLARTATSQDEQVFAQWAEAFRQRCAERDWVDSHSCIYSVRDDIASGAIQLSGPVRFIGFSSPEPQLVALSQVLQETGCWGGWGLPSSPEAISQRKLLCTDIRQENQSITNWVERSLAANPDALLGIVLPEAHDQGQSLRRSLHDHLAPGWQLSAAESCIVGGSDDTTLLDTGLVKAVMLALRISSGTLDYRELGHLLRSRYLQGWEKESEDRARLDLFCRHKNLHQIDVRSLLGLLERHEDFLLPGFIEILTEGSQLKSRERKSAAEWTAQIDNFLRNIGWGISCQLTSGEQNIVRRWQTVLEQFAALNDFVGKIGLSRVIGLLSELCREQSATTASGREPVQILGIAQATDYRFDGLWCAGMSSSAWPRAARMNPLISKLLQRDRGIPESLSGEFRHAESARFQSVIASAADVTMSWAEQQGEALFAPATALDPIEAADIGFLHLDTDDTGALEPLVAVQNDEPPPVSDPASIRGGTQVLKLQSNCPARAFYEIRLGAEPLPEPAFGIDYRLRGTIIHEALEQLYRFLRRVGGPQQASAEDLNKGVTESIEYSLNRHIPKTHPLSKMLHGNERLRLDRLLRDVVSVDQRRPSFQIAELEDKHEVQIGELSFRFRVDRIDALEEGQRLVIDYKSGTGFSMSSWAGERPGEPQLPAYAVTNDAGGIALIKVGDQRVALSGVGEDMKAHTGMVSPEKLGAEDWPSLVAVWREGLENLVAEFMAGDVRINSAKEAEAAGEFAMLTRLYSAKREVSE